MEEELNYLSDKIQEKENIIANLQSIAAKTGTRNLSIRKLNKEKDLLENILNKLTEVELS